MKNVELFTCECHFVSHNVIVHELRDGRRSEHDQVAVCPTLNHYLPWHARLKVAVKYVLGIDNSYDAYAETLLDRSNAERLRDYLTRFLTA